jgi:hypothetical protein
MRTGGPAGPQFEALSMPKAHWRRDFHILPALSVPLWRTPHYDARQQAAWEFAE